MNDLKIGQIITGEQFRDAIHMAVAPVEAGTDLYPAATVCVAEGKAYGGALAYGKPVGIVDPFLTGKVHEGQRFWLFLYPGSITSLRHEWTHPAFQAQPVDTERKATSRAWIEAFAGRLDQTYSRLMAAAEQWVYSEDYTYDNSETYKDFYDEFPTFWQHYEIVTGKTAKEKTSFFTCSC